MPLLVAVEHDGPEGPGRCSARVASDVTAGSYREFRRLHVGVLSRVRFDGYLPISCALASWPHAEAGRTPSAGEAGTWLRLAHKVVSNLRAYVQGTYHGLSAMRLQGAVDEFCWRYSHRAPGIASALLAEAARGHTPRAELLSSTFAAQGPGRKFRNRGDERRDNEAWVRETVVEATKERMANYAFG